jgi:hypothetical protein
VRCAAPISASIVKKLITCKKKSSQCPRGTGAREHTTPQTCDTKPALYTLNIPNPVLPARVLPLDSASRPTYCYPNTVVRRENHKTSM